MFSHNTHTLSSWNICTKSSHATYSMPSHNTMSSRNMYTIANCVWKVFPKPQNIYMAAVAALRPILLVLSQIPAYTAKPKIWRRCVTSCAYLLQSFHCYSLNLPTKGWPGWVDLHTIPACLWLPIHVLTRLNVEQPVDWTTNYSKLYRQAKSWQFSQIYYLWSDFSQSDIFCAAKLTEHPPT